MDNSYHGFWCVFLLYIRNQDSDPDAQQWFSLIMVGCCVCSLNEASPEQTAVELTAELNLSDEAPSSNNSSFSKASSCIELYQNSLTKIRDESCVVDPDPDWSRIQQLCGSGSTQVKIRYTVLEAKGAWLKTKIQHSETQLTKHFFCAICFL